MKKKKIITHVVLAVLIVTAIADIAGAYNLNFTLYNESGRTFRQVWISPNGSGNWRRDVDRVNVRPLRSGYNVYISTSNSSRLRNNRNTRYWDIRVYYDDTWHQWRGIDLSSITQFWVDSDFFATWD